MPLSTSLNKRIRARREEDEDEELSNDQYGSSNTLSDDSDPSHHAQHNEDGSSSSDEEASEEASEEDNDLDHSEDEDQEDDATTTLQNISFGALAKAQAALPPKKRKTHHPSNPNPNALQTKADEEEDPDPNPNPEPPTKKKSKRDLPSRSSKHAPTLLPSSRPTPRTRTVVSPPPTAPQARDPRFDSMISSASAPTTRADIASTRAASKNYAFLTEYRASELAELRTQIARSKNEDERARLKRRLTAMSDRQRAFERKQAAQEVVSRHRKKERELLKAGKKSRPYYLKKGDVKREVVKERWEGMKGGEQKKALERRRKKVAGREKKAIPWERRGAAGRAGAGEGE